MFLTEQLKMVPLFNNYDLSTHDTIMTSDSINMKNYHHATILINFHALGGADTRLYVYSGAAAAALTSTLYFAYAFGGAASGSASSDVLTAWAWTDSTTPYVTITNGTYDNYMMVLEVPATIMDLANNENWLHLNFTDPSTGATGNVTATAILRPRYMNNLSATALT